MVLASEALPLDVLETSLEGPLSASERELVQRQEARPPDTPSLTQAAYEVVRVPHQKPALALAECPVACRALRSPGEGAQHVDRGPLTP